MRSDGTVPFGSWLRHFTFPENSKFSLNRGDIGSFSTLRAAYYPPLEEELVKNIIALTLLIQTGILKLK